MLRATDGVRVKLIGCLSLLLAAGLCGWATVAEAQVTEPDGRPIPQFLTQDIGANEIAAFPRNSLATLSLDALFTSRGEDIDWQLDAATEPTVFSPLCGIKGTMVLRGGGCVVDFGWYNVDLTSDVPPTDDEIYPLVTKEQLDPAVLPPFQPYIGDPPIQGQPLENIRTDPRYTGGLIGLGIRGNDPVWCPQSKYSEHRLNVTCETCNPPAPWITALVWQSTATPNAFYMGLEDLPMVPNTFNGDGDFNDFVYFIEGITCQGGGVPCLTAAEGACAFGLTECQPDGSLECVQNLQARTELCDNIDNDCNGLVDDGDLCPQGEVCYKGTCNPNCSGGEFPCETPLVCDPESGYCVDPDCVGVECTEAGQVCVDGQCIGGCTDDVVCPVGQICQLGRCVDPCVSRRPGGEMECTGGNVCEDGVCVEPCHCRTCAAGKECDVDSGACVLDGCVGITCPPGQFCRAGECGDSCEGVVCPGGAECLAGKCGEPIPGQMSGAGGEAGGGSEPPIIIDVDAGVVIDAGAAAAGGAAGGSGDGDPSGATENGGDEPGCGCRAAGSPNRVAGVSALLLLALGFAMRRRSVRVTRG